MKNYKIFVNDMIKIKSHDLQELNPKLKNYNKLISMNLNHLFLVFKLKTL
jgi:hypothetical protein